MLGHPFTCPWKYLYMDVYVCTLKEGEGEGNGEKAKERDRSRERHRGTYEERTTKVTM